MKTSLFAAVFCALCLPAMAQSSPERVQTKAPPKDIKKLTPEEREKLLGVTPEARQAKLKERDEYIEKRRAELEKKKAAGTLTPQEGKLLQQMQARRKSVEQPAAKPAR